MKRNQFPRTCWKIATLSENFVWIPGLHLLELPCWELVLYDSSVHSKPGTILSSFTLKARNCPPFLHPLRIKNK